MQPSVSEDIEAVALDAIRAAIALVRSHRLAEVEIVVASDRSGTVHLRSRVSGVPLHTLVVEREGP